MFRSSRLSAPVSSFSDRKLLILAVFLLLASVTAMAETAEEPRFAPIGQLLQGRADWVSVFDDRVAFGSGRDVLLARSTPVAILESRFELDEPIREAVLSWNRLLINDGRRLGMLDLDSPRAASEPVWLLPEPRGPLHVARHGDHLVVAEDGVGLRFVALPLPRDHDMSGEHHGFPLEPTEVGRFSLDETITAVTSFGHRVYAAVEGKGIAVVDGYRLQNPQLVRHVALEQQIEALAANGTRLYLLGPDGLTILNLREDSVEVEGEYPDLSGSAIELAGRTLHLAGGDDGLITQQDKAALATTHFVTIEGLSFVPSNLMIGAGDTVQWDYAGGGAAHNVESCDGVSDPAGCSGVAVEGQFVQPFPMTATNQSFSVSHTFTVPGTNPYFCVIHANFGMTGSVTVSAPSPPGVPDGTAGTTPVTVAKGIGSSLRVFWDATTCTDAADYQVVSGAGSQLPGTFAGTYRLSDAACSIGTSGSFTWPAAPNPLPGDFSWFLVVANDGSSTEGSWGKNSGNVDRRGPGTGGSSGAGFCNAVKDLGNACGQ